MSRDFTNIAEGGGEPAETPLLRKIEESNPFPLSAFLELTNRCNLSCPHCYIPEKNRGNELATTEVYDTIDQLAESGAIWLGLTGGEPCLRKDLLEIVGYASNKRFCVSMTSNATLIDDRVARELFDAGLSKLSASIYHITPSLHDEFVGLKGAWERSIQALTSFSQLGGKANALITVMNWNSGSVPDLERFCRERSWLYTIDPSIFPRTDGDQSVLRYRVSREQLLDLYSNSELFLTSQEERPGEKALDGPVCGIGRSSSWIAPNGDLFTCRVLPWKLGNLREHCFRELWLSSPVLNQILSFRWRDSEQCAECTLSRYCMRCPGMCFLETGDPNKPSSIACVRADVRRETSGRA